MGKRKTTGFCIAGLARETGKQRWALYSLQDQYFPGLPHGGTLTEDQYWFLYDKAVEERITLTSIAHDLNIDFSKLSRFCKKNYKIERGPDRRLVISKELSEEIKRNYLESKTKKYSNSIGGRILEQIDRKGINVKELARHLHAAERRVYGWVYENFDMKAKDVIRVCEFFGISADYLLGLKGA